MASDETPADVEEVRPFAEWLHEQRKGGCHAELSDALNEVNRAVRETGRAGKLTLTISIKPAGKDGRNVLVSDEVKVTKPRFESEEALFFMDKNGNLSRDNPDQQRLPLHEVPRPHDAAPITIKDAR